MSFGSFWSILNFAHQSSQIDELFNNPDLTLEELLDDDNIISEFKGMNPRLLEFQTDERVKQLLSYLIEEPGEDADRNRGYKYPFVACEVMTADIQSLLSAFFGKNPYKEKPKQQETQEENNEGEFDDYQTSPTKETNEENTAETGAEEAEQKEDAAKESENIENTETVEAKEGEETVEVVEDDKENKEAAAQEEVQEKEAEGEGETKEETKEEETGENTEVEEPRTKERFSITVRRPQEDLQSEKSEEEEPAGQMELAHYFFSFLSSDELNVTLVGYFSRFLNHLLLRRTAEIVSFVWENPYIVDGLIRHVEHTSLAECLAKFFIMENITYETSGDFVEVRIEKLKKLVEIFNAEESGLKSELLSNTAYVINEIISKRSVTLKSQDFQAYFFSSEFLEVLFTNLFRHPILTTHLTNILNSLLQMIYQKKTAQKRVVNDLNESSDSQQENNSDQFDETVFYEHLVPKIDDIAEYLKSENQVEVGRTFGGGNQKAFGIGRLRTVEGIYHMIRLNENKVNMELGLKRVFNILMDLMVTYEWNNMLHNSIEKIFVSALESDSHVLKQKLLTQADLIGFLNTATKEVNYNMPNEQKRKLRKGYLGHITKIGKTLERLGESDSDIKDFLTNENWKEFYTQYLKPSIKTENHDLAGFTKKQSDDFMEENVHIGNNIEDALGGKFDAFYGFDQVQFNKPAEENNDAFDTFFECNKEGQNWPGENEAGVNSAITGSWPANFESQDFSQGFTDFNSEPKETATSEEVDIYLELNKEVKVIEVNQQVEVKLEQEYIESQYWARPKVSDVSVDDILAEFEQN